MFISTPTKSFIITYIKLLVWKTSSVLISESKHMSILFVINSSTTPILFLKEFTFSVPIVTFLASCNLCALTDGKTFSALSSAELFLLSELILSRAGLTGLSVLGLFTLKTKFLFTLFVIVDYSSSVCSVLFLVPMQVSFRQAFILKQKLLTRRVVPYSFK